MCDNGISCRSLNKEQLQCACSYRPQHSSTYTKPAWVPEHNGGNEYSPSYNIAPSNVTPVLIQSSLLKNVGYTSKILKPMLWGVIPPWYKGEYKKHGLTTNNCRLETINSSKLYGPLLRNGKRCIIVVEGYYEWDSKQTPKQPYYVYAPQTDNMKVNDPATVENTWSEEDGWKGINLLYIAGLYNVWQDHEEGTLIYSYTIITMESNEILNWMHHRMPAILSTQEQIDCWLDVDNVNPNTALTYLTPVKLLSWHAVSTLVNDSRNKSASCIEKQSPKKKKAVRTLNEWFRPVQKRKSDDGDVSPSVSASKIRK